MMRLLTFVAVLFLVAGCSHVPKFVGVYDFDQNSWAVGQNVVFDFKTLHSSTGGDIRFLLRYLPSAVGQRVCLAIKTTNRNNLFHTDTLDFKLARGAGDAIRSVEVVVRRGVIWPSGSSHYMTITPRSDLCDVVSIGLLIDNAINY